MAGYFLQAFVNTRAAVLSKRSNIRTGLSWSGCLLVFLCWFPLASLALEVRGKVSAVEDKGRVRIELPAGSVVAVGDVVRIEAELPGIGPVPIKTRWLVKEVSPGLAVAEPRGDLSGAPQRGYVAVIETSAMQGVAEAPPEAAAPEHECDRLAAFPGDPGRVGDGVAFNEIMATDAIRACRTAVTDFPGTPRFIFQLGRALHSAGNVADALSWYRQAADLGHAAAKSNLGYVYANGAGVERDDTAAFGWYRQAAEAGVVTAMAQVGVFYNYGRGVARDYRQAAQWYRMAAERGNGAAMTHLGILYRDGQGVERNPKTEVMWYRRAAEKGNLQGMYNLGHSYALGDGVAKDLEQAVRWFREASDRGLPDAIYSLARSYDKGEGVEKDPAAAAILMLRALESGHALSIQQMTTNANAWSQRFRRELQQLLKYEGVYSGAIDGSFGPGTRRAIEALTNR